MAEHPGILTTHGEGTQKQLVAAMRVAERLLPRFTDIVRTSSGDPNLRVVIATGAPTASTDGATVLMPLDPRLAYVDPLNPCTCDDDPYECIYHFSVGLLLHEGAHVSEGSTKKPDEEFYRRFAGRGKSLARVAGLTGYFEEFSFSSTLDFSSALELVHEFNWMAPGLANAFEDARINKAVGDKRSALGQQMRRIIDDFISEFATSAGFSQTPAAYQVGASVEISIEHGLDLTPMVHSDAARGCLSDPVVKSICEVDMDCTAHACAAAVIVAEYARLKYGLFDQSPDNEWGTGRQTETGRDTDGEGSMRAAQRNREVGDLSDESQQLVRQANRAAEADRVGTKQYLQRHPSRRGPKQPDEVINKAAEGLQRYDEEVGDLDDAMNQPGGSGYAIAGSEGEYQPIILRPDLQNDQGAHPNLIGDGFTYYAGGAAVRLKYNELESDAYTHLVQSKRQLADALGHNRRSANSPNLLRGRLHGSKLARVPTGNRRAFRRIDKPRKRSYAVLIGVDLSGSTGGGRERELRRMAYAQASLLDSLGIRFAVVGHTGTRYRTNPTAGSRDCDFATARTVCEVREVYGDGNVGLATHKLAKNFAEPWNESAKLAMAAFRACSANLDGVTMQTYINMLCTQPATDRILLYYTDGQMPAEDHDNQLTILKRQLRRARAMAKQPDRRLHVVGIALDCDTPKKYGLDTILVDSDKPDESVRLVVEGLAERIARTINK